MKLARITTFRRISSHTGPNALSMRSSAATSKLCLPVTALEHVLLGQIRLLLVGQGPFLYVYDLETNQPLLRTRIFEIQAIHGVDQDAVCVQDSNLLSLRISLFGGSSVVIAVLKVGHEKHEPISCNVNVTRVYQAPDWILKVRHHVFGTGSSRSTRVVLLTANNCLYKIRETADDVSEPTLDVLAQGPKSSLYSADIRAHSQDHLLVAGGSVFGEVINWACKKSDLSSQWIAHAKYSFQGHRGSIFGVCISPQLSAPFRHRRFVASCSDDRTIQVWDVTDHESRTKTGIKSNSTIVTGFGHDEPSTSGRLAMISGHVSRIWDVDFVIDPRCSLDAQKKTYLVSRGEDATCQVWSLNLARNGTDPVNPMTLRYVSADHHHSGKSILAWTQYEDGTSTTMISGGADGKVVRRPLWLIAGLEEPFYTQAFKVISVDRKAVSLKDYLIIDIDTVTATTTTGLLLKGQNMSGSATVWHADPVSTLTPVTKLCSNSLENVLVSATKNGLLVSIPGNPCIFVPLQIVQPISWMRLVSFTAIDHHWHELLVVVTFPNPQLAMLVRINTACLDYEQETVRLDVPNKFLITSACYCGGSDVLFLGSRTGSLLIRSGNRRNTTDLFPTYDIHASDAVTSLQIVQTSESHLTHVLSTGRHGTFAIHAVQVRSRTVECSFQTLFKSSPQLGLNIEGAVLAWTPSKIQPDLILFGFQSTSFVVWNHTKQAQMLSIDCGGSHRNWAYHLSPDAKQHALVWTKASTYNCLKRKTSTPVIVQEGGHGREIKALAIRPWLHGEGNRQNVLATGAEDTTIRLSAFQSSTAHFDSSHGEFGLQPLIRLTEHTTGVQHLAFSSCGNYLFSSGGSGELFVWSLIDNVPVVGLGVTLLDRMIQADDDTDARILNFDVLPCVPAEDYTGCESPIRLVAAYSNGKVRTLDFTPDLSTSSGHFIPSMEILYGTSCLTQVRLHPIPSNSSMMILVAGTNGHIYGHPLETTAFNRLAHGIHQSSVLAMDCIALDPCSIVATGGDDNAFAFTILPSSENLFEAPTTKDQEMGKIHVASSPNTALLESNQASSRTRTVIMPKAHAAALTALKIVGQQEHSWGYAFIVITVGNDQRVKAWGVKLNTADGSPSEHLEDLQIMRLHEAWTCVADVSNIDLLGPIRRSGSLIDFEVVIVGVGIEVLRITLEWKA